MSTGTMPVAALAATLMLALPAADAAAGASSHLLPEPGAGSPGEAGAGEAQSSVQIADRTGQAAALRAPKPAGAIAKGPQVAALGSVAAAKPGTKPRIAGPVPRPAARTALPPRPPARLLPVRSPQAQAGLPMPMVITPSIPAGAEAPQVTAVAYHDAAHGPVHGPVHGPAASHHAVSRAPHQVGVASYYSRRFDGRLMANGQRFDPHSDSIAHRSLPFGTRVRIVNMTNGRSVLGTVRDRGPYARGRLLDVSPRIASDLGMIHSGLARVAVWHDGRGAVEIAEAP